MIGETIGHYKVIDKIGEGGMGTVYKAEDTTLRRLVALKTLSPHMAEDEEARRRFLREAEAASSLNHPNITTIHELLEDEGRHHICMEYVEGKTIRDMVESGHVSVRKAVDIILQAAEALEAAHSKGILHRDIKSANIMVTMEGRVKVMDFGLAHLEDRSKLTRTGTTMGTLAYSSPEQVTGRQVDERSEIWSLGVVFYELLTGRLPFKSPSEGELVFGIMNNEPDRPTEIREDIPDSVCMLIDQMLFKEPESRYQSCGELIGDLKAIRSELETSTLSLSTAHQRTGSWRRTLTVGLVAVVATVSLAVTLLSGRGGSSDLDPSRVAVAPFRNETGMEQADTWGGMIAYTINQSLQRLGNVTFVPAEDARASWGYYQGLVGTDALQVSPLVAFAEDFGAGKAVSGFYSAVGDSLSFFAEITDVRERKSPETIGPETGPITDPQQAIKRLADRVIGHFALTSNERIVATQGAPSLEAWRAFEKGLEFYLGESGTDAIPWDEALEAFYEAHRLDPDFHLPQIYAVMVLANIRRLIDPTRTAEFDSVVAEVDAQSAELSDYEKSMFQAWAEASRGDPGWRERRYQATKRAAEMAPGSKIVLNHGIDALKTNRPAEAVRVLESLDAESGPMRGFSSFPSWKCDAYHLLGDHEGELVSAREGRELYPEAHDGWYNRSYEIWALAALGRLSELEAAIDECLLLTPGHRSAGFVPSGNYSAASVMLHAARELEAHGHDPVDADRLRERAIDWYRSEPERETRWPSGLAHAFYTLERWDEAQAIYEDLAEDDPDGLLYQARLGLLAAQRDNRSEALRISSLLEERSLGAAPRRLAFQAEIAAHLGDLQKAVDLLREAFSLGLTPLWVHTEPVQDLTPLRGYPPFERLMEPKEAERGNR